MNYFTFALITGCVVVNSIPLESTQEDYSKFFGNTRIVGGQDAPENYAPYKTALVFGIRPFVFLMCGGSIVSKNHVLTAAHCIDPFIWSEGQLMRSFHGRIASNTWDSGGYTINFKEHHNHPLWDRDTIKYDVGVLNMTEPLKLNDAERVAIIALNYNWVGGGVKSFVAGWGRLKALGPIPRQLQLLHVSTITPEECAAGVEEAGQGRPTPPIYPHAEICTFHSVGHGMCNGDSGSALVSEKDRKQIGIASWAFPCAIGAPDVFTRIYGMKDFLQPILEHR